MRHPYVDFRIPERYVALLDWILDGYDPEDGEAPYDVAESKVSDCFYDVDSFLLAARANFAMDGVRPEQELAYFNHPLEVIPFAHNGGDALCYAWALLAPELDLDELPCVSFAPEYEAAVWLGDDTGAALETLLVAFDQDRKGDVDEKKRAALCKAVGLAPNHARKDVGFAGWMGTKRRGERHPRRLSPVVPAGYHFEATNDGIGVLAPSSAFAPGPVDAGDLEGEKATLAAARRFLRKGQPASALVALKQGRYDGKTPRPVVEMRREAFIALGRPGLAARATSWLAWNAE